MIKNEEYDVTMEQVLAFSRQSFGRLLAVFEPQVSCIFFSQFITKAFLQGLVQTSLCSPLRDPAAPDLPRELCKLVKFLKAQPQVRNVIYKLLAITTEYV